MFAVKFFYRNERRIGEVTTHNSVVNSLAVETGAQLPQPSSGDALVAPTTTTTNFDNFRDVSALTLSF